MTSTLLITGGTGTLGRLVVPRLRGRGPALRILSRTHREPEDGLRYATGDLLTGEGLPEAFAGADTVLHLAGGPKGDDVAARHLVAAARAAGVRHLAAVSVVGADRVPLAWFRGKSAMERAVAESGIPWTVLRAAQFHELLLKVLGTLAASPVVPAPPTVRLEPVAADEVAARLAGLALGAPGGRVPDLAGPEALGFPDLARAYLSAAGRRRALLPVPLAGRVGRAYRGGANLAGPGADRGTRRWEEALGAAVRTGR